MSDETPAPTRPVKVEIQLDEDTAQGMYVNLALVNHTETEFCLDFAYIQPQQPRARVRARVIMSPRHAKRLIMALQENLRRYEDKFGIIQLTALDPATDVSLQ